MKLFPDLNSELPPGYSLDDGDLYTTYINGSADNSIPTQLFFYVNLLYDNK